jgi:hypothetical protein
MRKTTQEGFVYLAALTTTFLLKQNLVPTYPEVHVMCKNNESCITMTVYHAIVKLGLFDNPMDSLCGCGFCHTKKSVEYNRNVVAEFIEEHPEESAKMKRVLEQILSTDYPHSDTPHERYVYDCVVCEHRYTPYPVFNPMEIFYFQQRAAAPPVYTAAQQPMHAVPRSSTQDEDHVYTIIVPKHKAWTNPSVTRSIVSQRQRPMTIDMQDLEEDRISLQEIERLIAKREIEIAKRQEKRKIDAERALIAKRKKEAEEKLSALESKLTDMSNDQDTGTDTE